LSAVTLRHIEIEQDQTGSRRGVRRSVSPSPLEKLQGFLAVCDGPQFGRDSRCPHCPGDQLLIDRIVLG
jgi:hypothetical protein